MTHEDATIDGLLMRYAAGNLSPAPALVVACHLAMSPTNRRLAHGLESIGGMLVDDAPIAPLSAGLFERTVAKLDQSVKRPDRMALGPNQAANDKSMAMPAPLARRSIGRWKWLGPGMHYARVEMPEDPEHNLVLLRVPPGRNMPEHSHSGEEVTLVLKGAFHDDGGRYGVGDLILEDQKTSHAPRVDADGECICLAAIEGPMRIKGVIGRLIQPFIGL